jgi:hypothetical protein
MLSGADRGFEGARNAVGPIRVETALELQFQSSFAVLLGDFHARVNSQILQAGAIPAESPRRTPRRPRG